MVENNIKNTVEELTKVISINNVIGEPIDAGDKILIPVMKMGFGFGSASVIGSKEGSGAGAGAALEPVSLVVVPKNSELSEGIRVLSISKGSELNKAISDLGLVVGDFVKEALKERKKDKEENQTATEQIESKTINID